MITYSNAFFILANGLAAGWCLKSKSTAKWLGFAVNLVAAIFNFGIICRFIAAHQ